MTNLYGAMAASNVIILLSCGATSRAEENATGSEGKSERKRKSLEAAVVFSDGSD